MSIESKVVAELRDAGFRVLTREEWGSKALGIYQQRRISRRFVGPADHAFAHITVTHDTGDARGDARVVERIGLDRFGTGWSYNWGIHRSTKTIILGQPHDAAGAHTLNDKGVAGFPDNLNYWGHAIAYIAMPGAPFDDWCRSAVAAILAAEKKHGAMKPSARLYPHSKFAYKDCPCDPYRDSIPEVEELSTRVLKDPQKAKDGRLSARIGDTIRSMRGDVRAANRADRPKYVERLKGIRSRLRNLKGRLK